MIRIAAGNRKINAVVPLTPSKSITNRALIIRELAGKNFEIINLADAEDSRILSDILAKPRELVDVRDAGTAFRFLTAYLSNREGTFLLTGSDRMKKRPVGKLVHALRSIGAEIEFTERENFPPLRINGRKLSGGAVKIDASESSQFISALLMIAPVLEKGLRIELTGKIYSFPYINTTILLMRYFGIEISFDRNIINILPQQYLPKEITVENDWSAASFWYVIVALSEEASVVLKGLSKNSIQGDSVVDQLMKTFGVESMVSGDDIMIFKNKNACLPEYYESDFSGCPDLVIPMSVLCSALRIKSKFNGVKNLRIKESDRLLALKEELKKTGANILLEEDSFSLTSFDGADSNIVFHSYNDHRIVMSLATLAMIRKEVVIDDHLAVNKSYPGFWQQIRAAGFDYIIS